MDKLEFDGLPPTINRYYGRQHAGYAGGDRYLLPSGKRYKRSIGMQCIGKGLPRPPAQGYYRVTVKLIVKNHRKMDITNRIKPLEDALSGIVYPDDKDIWKFDIERELGSPEKTIVQWEVQDETPQTKK